MPNVRLVIEYDGSGFHGWQRQPGLRTIQGELERVLRIVLREDIPVVHSAGRTDAGVHARAQVVNFLVSNYPDLDRLRLSVSSLLRGEVTVLRADIVPNNFHSRRSSEYKQYSYHILNRPCPPSIDKGRVWHVAYDLDVGLMQEEAQEFIGTHDFSSFRGQDCTQVSPVKEILESDVSASGSYIVYRVIGRGFLKQMVRIMVGTIVGRGRHHSWIRPVKEILEAKSRHMAGKTAPPCGLYLDWVKYPEPLNLIEAAILPISLDQE